jgi:hypothetical protein
MKGELGTDQAMQFKDAMGAALSTLAETLNTTKEQMDAAVAIVTGEEIASPMGDLEGVDMDADMDVPMDMDMEPVPVPNDMDSDLGREKR